MRKATQDAFGSTRHVSAGLAREGSGLSRYLRAIGRMPMLEAVEEQDLARRSKDQDDDEARRLLVASHLRLAAKVAMGYQGYGLPLSDLISEANLGLLKAANRFDPEHGARFSTYAAWWIRAALYEYVLRSWSLVGMGPTAKRKKLFFNLRRLKKQLQGTDNGPLSPQQAAVVASALDVSEAEVNEMDRRLCGPDLSLNTPVGGEMEGDWQDRIAAPAVDQETWLAEKEEITGRRTLLMNALGKLKERERRILTERRLTDSRTTLEDLAKVYGISRERVRQIENAAFAKVAKAVLDASGGPRHAGRRVVPRPLGTALPVN